jgi:serine phosphatase RsbU (regulator of sigma subunit)
VREQETELRAPDIVLLNTDGVSEARSPSTAEFYGDDRVSELLQRFVGGSVHRLVAALVADVVDFSDGTTRDDVAVLAVSVTG